jgi:hypothetical protein
MRNLFTIMKSTNFQKTIGLSVALGLFLVISLLVPTQSFAQAYSYYGNTSYYPTWADLGPGYSTGYQSYPYYQTSYPYNYYQPYQGYSNYPSDNWAYNGGNYYPYQSSYTYSYGGSSSSSTSPKAVTSSVLNIEDTQAELRGSVDMNDYDNGIVFFVYGQDEDAIDDVDSDYDSYDDVDDEEEDDDFMVVRVDTNLDGDEDYNEEVTNLEADEDYFVTLCVEYERSNDETLTCGSVREFTTESN